MNDRNKIQKLSPEVCARRAGWTAAQIVADGESRRSELTLIEVETLLDARENPYDGPLAAEWRMGYRYHGLGISLEEISRTDPKQNSGQFLSE